MRRFSAGSLILGATLAVIAGCGGNSPEDDGFTPSPTPTPTGSPTATATPVPTPPATPFAGQMGWVTTGGTVQLWFTVQANFSGTIEAVRALSTLAGCDVYVEPAETVANGETVVFLLDETGACSAQADYRFEVDYRVTDVPGLHVESWLTQNVGATPSAGQQGVLSNLATFIGTTQQLRMRMDSTADLTITQVYALTETHAAMVTCEVANGGVYANITNYVDVCDPAPFTPNTNYDYYVVGTDLLTEQAFFTSVNDLAFTAVEASSAAVVEDGRIGTFPIQ